MKGLTLTQPWATLVAIGAKQIETRSWATSYRGPIAIHAGKGWGFLGGKALLSELCCEEPFRVVLDPVMGSNGEIDRLPRGCIVAVAELVDCVPTANVIAPHHGTATWRVGEHWWLLSDRERAFGDYSRGRYGWLLANVRRLATPVPCRGALQLWAVPPDVRAAVETQLERAA